MNCQQFQASLFEYLDETLSPADHASAQMHLQQCADCRAAFRRHEQFAETISAQLKQRAETIALDDTAQRRIANAVQNSIEPSGTPFWLRLILPVTATGALAALLFFAAHIQSPVPVGIAQIHQTVPPSIVTVDISFSTPTYIFSRQGNTVMDALITEPDTATETLVAKN